MPEHLFLESGCVARNLREQILKKKKKRKFQMLSVEEIKGRHEGDNCGLMRYKE